MLFAMDAGIDKQGICKNCRPTVHKLNAWPESQSWLSAQSENDKGVHTGFAYRKAYVSRWRVAAVYAEITAGGRSYLMVRTYTIKH